MARGTFSHRHGALIDQKTGKPHVPLNFLGAGQGQIQYCNSNLSEFAVLGYEYGYDLASTSDLIVWEAQFGDFFNGAQIIIDTFISSGESKWLLQSGLVLLLPHGYDGTGPEHSSCRLERFLQMSNDSISESTFPINMRIANPTCPSQYFHLLRRQAITKQKRPLIIASPKVLLRLPAATCSIHDLVSGSFKPVIDSSLDPERTETLVFVSGKAYYEIEKERKQRDLNNIAIVRIEELSPFPFKETKEIFKKYAKAKKVVWFQEESQNMGTYSYAVPRLQAQTPLNISYVGRNASAAPATGISKVHKQELSDLLKSLFK